MSEPAKESDALVVARWCWPSERWSETAYVDRDGVRRVGALQGARPTRFCSEEHEDVADAERVLIERGHAEAYGRALWVEVLDDVSSNEEEKADTRRSGMLDIHRGADFANLATAPLEARVRAMAATIRDLESDK